MIDFLTRATKRLLGFGASTLVVGLSNVLVIPLIVENASAAGWASIALAQSIGTIGAIIVAFGWGAVGPALIAGSDQRTRHLEYAQSVVVRVSLFIPCAIGCIAITTTIVSEFEAAAVLMSASSCAIGLSAIWYFVGSSDPRALFLSDTIPRTLGLVTGIVALICTQQLIWYAAIQLSAALAAFSVSSIVILRRPNSTKRYELRPAPLLRSMRKQYVGIGTGMTSAAYQALPTVLVGMFAPLGLAQFALADRIQKLSNTALRPVSQTMQGWVPALGTPSRDRVKRALVFSATAGLMAGSVLALAGPAIGDILGSNQIEIDLALSLPVGLTLCLSIISQCSGMACLMALGKSAHVLFSSLAGAAVCVPLCVGLSSAFGAPGAAWSIAIAESIVTVYQLAILGVHFRASR